MGTDVKASMPETPVNGVTSGAGVGNSPVIQSISQILIHLGGLKGLLSRLHEQGLDELVEAWVVKKELLPLSERQLVEVVGEPQLSQLAQAVDIPSDTLSQQISQILPAVVDRLTPENKIPANPIAQPEVVNAIRAVLESALH